MTGSSDFNGRPDDTLRAVEPVVHDALQRIAGLAAGPRPKASPALTAFLIGPTSPVCSAPAPVDVLLPAQRRTTRAVLPTTAGRRRWRMRLAAVGVVVSHLSIGAKCALAAVGVAATVAAATQVGQADPVPAEPAPVPASISGNSGGLRPTEQEPASSTGSDAPNGADDGKGPEDRSGSAPGNHGGAGADDRDDRTDADERADDESDGKPGEDGRGADDRDENAGPDDGNDHSGEEPQDDSDGKADDSADKPADEPADEPADDSSTDSSNDLEEESAGEDSSTQESRLVE